MWYLHQYRHRNRNPFSRLLTDETQYISNWHFVSRWKNITRSFPIASTRFRVSRIDCINNFSPNSFQVKNFRPSLCSVCIEQFLQICVTSFWVFCWWIWPSFLYFSSLIWIGHLEGIKSIFRAPVEYRKMRS